MKNHNNKIDYYNSEIEKFSGSCGCQTGGIFVMLALLYIIIKFFTLPSLTFTIILQFSWYSLKTIFLTGFIGKMIGLSTAKLRVLYLEYRVKKILSQNLKENGNLYTMGQ
jgi:hypothetical protein